MVGLVFVLATLLCSGYLGFTFTYAGHFNAILPPIFVCPAMFILNRFFKSLGRTSLVTHAIGTIAELLATEYSAVYLFLAYFSIAAIITRVPFYITLLLLDVASIFPDLRYVIYAVIQPIKQLLLTFVFMLILLFVFAWHSMLLYADLYTEGECRGVTSCFFYTVYRGTVTGGNIGFYFGSGRHVPVQEAIFQYVFVWVLGSLLLNIIVAIIFDSFGSLRDARKERKQNLASFCFISGLPVEVVKNAAKSLGLPNGFRDHEERSQNMWDYASFIIYVQTKDAYRLTGPESCIKQMLHDSDHRWIPTSRSLLVEQAEQQGQQVTSPVEVALSGMDSRLANLERMMKQLHAKLPSDKLPSDQSETV
eukprot:gnl/TRDRNA2_/TRDRNA2_143297_c1_seq1.p1 gnl/TRDRNA2_/TRDRNA2_143297_c1~~gnl/TRDRNA2_/TRDRNA2_143297_c1_seq1.p1  ORF type:complete len:427 (+),score=52.03 gnl/TRDRNA2_/TRDRNA2_143297_c1_seq1:191-1282(+)